MKIDMTKKVQGLNGSEIENAPTLKEVCIQSLVSTLKGDENLSGLNKFELAKLAQKVDAGDIVDLESGDIVKIKDRIGMAYGPVVILWAWNCLEGAVNAANAA